MLNRLESSLISGHKAIMYPDSTYSRLYERHELVDALTGRGLGGLQGVHPVGGEYVRDIDSYLRYAHQGHRRAYYQN